MPSPDPLADILNITRLGNAQLSQAELLPPWGLSIDETPEAAMHIVQRGRLWLRVHGESDPVEMHTGDLVLLRAGVGHSLFDDPSSPVVPHREGLASMARRVDRLPSEARDVCTRVICAKYFFESEGPHPLMTLLPRWFLLRDQTDNDGAQLRGLSQLLAGELEQAARGGQFVIPRLVDSLLVLVVRTWLNRHAERAEGWFGALRDPAIARALALIHAEPERAWTVEGLARTVAQSRATFARRFLACVGSSPVAYLGQWRMCVAAKQLADSELGLEGIARNVGYDSVSAFSKAFRRSHGVAPGQYRSQARARQQGAS